MWLAPSPISTPAQRRESAVLELHGHALEDLHRPRHLEQWWMALRPVLDAMANQNGR